MSAKAMRRSRFPQGTNKDIAAPARTRPRKKCAPRVPYSSGGSSTLACSRTRLDALRFCRNNFQKQLRRKLIGDANNSLRIVRSDSINEVKCVTVSVSSIFLGVLYKQSQRGAHERPPLEKERVSRVALHWSVQCSRKYQKNVGNDKSADIN